MPGHAVRAAILLLIIASLTGGPTLVANVDARAEHIVAEGDTLDTIARARGVPVAEVAALNGLANPDALAIGDVLRVPPPDPPVAARPSGGEYVVRAGDSLSQIARSVGVSHQALAEANRLEDPDRLTVGQRLALPAGAGSRGAGAQAARSQIATPPPAAEAASRSMPPAAPVGPARPTTTAPLPARVLAAARAVAGLTVRIGVAGLDLASGQRLAIAADEAFPAASVAKLPILVEAYRQHVAGRRPLSDAARADLRRMIAVSDNDAANRLIDLLGLPAVNQGAARLGLAGTRLANHFGTAGPTGGINQTTPADMARLLELLAAERLVSPAGDRDIRYLLSLNSDGSKIRRGLPDGTRLAHKSGWFDGVANDVGIVTHPRGSYVLAVFTQGIRDAEAANDAVAAVARVVHAAWAAPLR